jgi:RNA polymerase sigma-70 factor (ECF subfamily)
VGDSRTTGEAVTRAGLSEGVRSGDDEAFVAAVLPHQARLLRLVGRLVPTRDDAEDVVQEAIIAAYRQRRRFRGDASFGTWLGRIAIYTALRFARQQRRGASTASGERPPSTGPGEPAARIAVRDAVARLPEKLRVPIILRFYEGLSGQEIAELLGCKQSTVWTRLYRGLQRLRNDLQEG